MGRNIFLVIGVVVGVCVAAPIVISYATIWWWLSAPLLVVYSVVLWRWGLAWAIDEDAASAPVLTKVLCVFGLLLWTFVGVALAVFLAMLAAQYWIAVVASLLLVLAVGLGFWVADLIDKARKRAVAPEPPKPDDLVR